MLTQTVRGKDCKEAARKLKFAGDTQPPFPVLIQCQFKDTGYRGYYWVRDSAYAAKHFAREDDHAFEVLTGECKAYCDIEFDGSLDKDSTLENAMWGMIIGLGSIGLQVLTVAFAASKPQATSKCKYPSGIKHSYHIIFQTDYPFASSKELSILAPYLKEYCLTNKCSWTYTNDRGDEVVETAIDLCVYSSEQGIKMVNQTKFGAPREYAQMPYVPPFDLSGVALFDLSGVALIRL